MSLMSYLRFRIKPEADPSEFESDLHAMAERAATQPGFMWSETGRDPGHDRTFIVVSEWEEVDHVRAWERDGDHGAMMDKWEPMYAEEMQHRRFVPWVRPPKPPQ